MPRRRCARGRAALRRRSQSVTVSVGRLGRYQSHLSPIYTTSDVRSRPPEACLATQRVKGGLPPAVVHPGGPAGPRRARRAPPEAARSAGRPPRPPRGGAQAAAPPDAASCHCQLGGSPASLAPVRPGCARVVGRRATSAPPPTSPPARHGRARYGPATARRGTVRGAPAVGVRKARAYLACAASVEARWAGCCSGGGASGAALGAPLPRLVRCSPPPSARGPTAGCVRAAGASRQRPGCSRAPPFGTHRPLFPRPLACGGGCAECKERSVCCSLLLVSAPSAFSLRSFRTHRMPLCTGSLR